MQFSSTSGSGGNQTRLDSESLHTPRGKLHSHFDVLWIERSWHQVTLAEFRSLFAQFTVSDVRVFRHIKILIQSQALHIAITDTAQEIKLSRFLLSFETCGGRVVSSISSARVKNEIILSSSLPVW